jgi:uncharacterized protein
LGPEPGELVVRISADAEGLLRSASAEGHAGLAPAGSNIACAAVTVLLRTAYETLAQYEGVDLAGEAPSPGYMTFRVRRYAPEAAERLRGVGDFLLTGLSSIEREFPAKVRVILDSERRQ